MTHPDRNPADEIRHTITAFSHHVDHRRWPELQALFTESVVVDYTSLFGGQVQTVSGADLIASWRTRLGPLSATQHLLGPIEVEVRDGHSKAGCHVRGYHFRAGLPGGSEWMVAGHYLFSLRNQGGQWKIERVELEFSYQTGNANLLDEAAKQ
jgi:SnoaL-like protein